MSSIQQVTEQECMDKLHWDVDRVANASDEEMVYALNMFYKKAGKQSAAVPPPPPPQSLSAPSSPPTNTRKSDVHIVGRLRDSIRMKTLCISSDDILAEDIDLLRTSIDSDNQLLKQELNSIRDQLDLKRTEETKKYKIRSLLQKVVHSVGADADIAHLKEVDVQLTMIKENIKRMNNIIG
jgi:hypothetical protein